MNENQKSNDEFISKLVNEINNVNKSLNMNIDETNVDKDIVNKTTDKRDMLDGRCDEETKGIDATNETNTAARIDMMDRDGSVGDVDVSCIKSVIK